MSETIYLIEARTGCTCCASENHFRGPYRTEDDAQRRIDYYHAPDSKFWPTASQYAHRGSYHVVGVAVERLPDGRVILDERYVVPSLQFIEVREDGTIVCDEEERFDGIPYL